MRYLPGAFVFIQVFRSTFHFSLYFVRWGADTRRRDRFASQALVGFTFHITTNFITMVIFSFRLLISRDGIFGALYQAWLLRIIRKDGMNESRRKISCYIGLVHLVLYCFSRHIKMLDHSTTSLTFTMLAFTVISLGILCVAGIETYSTVLISVVDKHKL